MEDLKEDRQLEDFEINEQVLNNLDEDEDILFKVKTIKASFIKKWKWLFYIMILSVVVQRVIFTIRDIIEGRPLFGEFDLILWMMIPIYLVIFLIMMRNFNKPSDHQLYFTTQKLFKIYISGSSEIKTLELKDINAISYCKTMRFAKNPDLEIISERINVYSKYSKAHSYTFPVLHDLQQIIKKVESILWYQCDLKNKLEGLKRENDIRIPHEFNSSKNSLKLYADRIEYFQGDKRIEIRFSQDMYLTYQPWTTKSGYIIIQPIYKDPVKIKFKLGESYMRVFTIIYLQFLNWKNENKLLFDEDQLQSLQKTLESKLKQEKQEKTLYLEHPEYSQQDLEPFEKYMNKDEKVFLTHFPEMKPFTIIFYLILNIMGVVFVFLLYVFMIDPPISFGSLYIGIFMVLVIGQVLLCIGPILLFSYLSTSSKNYVFTDRQIILKQRSKFGCTSYKNISSITYQDILKRTRITKIELKEPLESERFIDKTSIYISGRKKLKLYEKITSIKDKVLKT